MKIKSGYIFLKVYRLCPGEMKVRFRFLLFLMLILAFLETATVGLIAFYAAAISNPQSSFEYIQHKAGIILPVLGTFLSSPKILIGVLSVLLVLSVPLKNIFRGFVTYRIARYSAEMEAYFGEQLLGGILARDYRWHIGQNSADLITKVNWRHHLGRNFVRPYLNVICEVFMLIVLFAGILWAQPLVSLLVICVQGGTGALVYRAFRHNLDKSARSCRECDVEMNRHITRAIHGVKDVKISGTIHFFVEGFVSQVKKFSRMFGQQQFWRESPLLALESIGFALISFAILMMLFVLDYSPLQTTGTAALLAVTAWRTLPAFNRVVSSLAGIRSARPYVLSLLETLLSNPDLKVDDYGLRDVIDFKHEIRFEDVGFSYNSGNYVFENLNLRIVKGSSVGIMGPSGCGKSTLIDLLCGLLQPTKGEIFVDGERLNGNKLSSWQKNIGYVPQSPYIFDGSLLENIAFGHKAEDVDREKILSTCQMAGIDYLDNLSDGLDTPIGERGIRLSGGQSQRIAIARALFKKPQLLILDEATSALDEEKEAEIRELLNPLKGEQTLVVVSHRPSTLIDCDQIINLGDEPLSAVS